MEEIGVNEVELGNTPIQVNENETYNKDDIEGAVEITEDEEDDGNPFE